MSTWVEGRAYDYYGDTLICRRRFFVGSLEHVELSYPDSLGPDGVTIESPRFVRTARALAPCVKPRVTETLGGVLRPDACDHRHYGRVTANAGPYAGQVCCDACGGPVGPTAAPDTGESELRSQHPATSSSLDSPRDRLPGFERRSR